MYKEIDPDLISRETTAGLLGISLKKLDYATASGEVPAPYRFGARCLLYSRREIEAFAAQRDAATAKETERAAAAKAAAAKRSSRSKVSA